MTQQRSTLLMVTAALLGATLACQGRHTAGSVEADRRELAAAATAFVRQHAVPGIKFQLTVEGLEGDYARLRAEAPDLTPVRVFMKRVNGSWVGIDVGSAVDPDDLARQGFPARVRQ